MAEVKYCNILEGLDNYDPYKQDRSKLSHITKLSMYLDSLQAVIDLQHYVEVETKKNGTDINTLDGLGRAALHWIVGQNYERGCEILLRERAQINVLTQNESFTPLMVSCRKGGSSLITQYLLEHKADHSIRAKSSATAFHIAVASGSRNCMRFLILKGADPFLPLTDRRTAIDLAKTEKMKSFVYSCYRSAVIYREKRDKTCAYCGKSRKKLDRCGRCYVTFYCNQGCQKEHWLKYHKDGCPGSLIAIVEKDTGSTSDTPNFKYLNPDKAFVVKYHLTSGNDHFFRNEALTLLAKVSGDVYVHPQGVSPSATYYWAKFCDSAKRKLHLYAGRPLPRPTYVINSHS